MYEGYGTSGVAVIVEASTDNRNRFTKIYAEYNNLELYIFSNNNNSIFYYSKLYNTFCAKKDKYDRKLKECRVNYFKKYYTKRKRCAII